MLVIPEYVVTYHKIIHNLIQTSVIDEDRERLENDFAIQFTIGMWTEQKTHSIDWMRNAVTASKLGEEQAAETLGVKRTTLNRWLNGKVDPPFAQLQRFYASFGGSHEHDHPFQPRDVLNLGGYFQTLLFLKQWLQERGLETKPIDTTRSINLEVFMCLFNFYANIEAKDIQTRSSQRELTEFIQETLNAVHKVIPKEKCEIQTTSEFQKVVAYWGLPWLLCLTLIAEDENGVEAFRVSTKRPVRLF